MNVASAIVFLTLFSTIILLVGLYAIVTELLVQKTWMPSYAEISASDIEYDYSSDNQFYWPVIVYVYRHESVDYTGNCCQVGFDDYAGAEAFIKKTVTTKRTEIYINPNNPSESRLKADVNPFTIPNLALLFIGILMTTISAMIIYVQSEA
jgi:hypothetical protein